MKYQKYLRLVLLMMVSLALMTACNHSRRKPKYKPPKTAVICPTVKAALQCIRYSANCPPRFKNDQFDIIEATEDNTRFMRATYFAAQQKILCVYEVTVEEGKRDYGTLEFIGTSQKPDLEDGEGEWLRGDTCESSDPEDCPFDPAKH